MLIYISNSWIINQLVQSLFNSSHIHLKLRKVQLIVLVQFDHFFLVSVVGENKSLVKRVIYVYKIYSLCKL